MVTTMEKPATTGNKLFEAEHPGRAASCASAQQWRSASFMIARP